MDKNRIPGAADRRERATLREASVTNGTWLHYSLQVTRKTEDGEDQPDRDAQIHHINALVDCALAGRQPKIAVDTKN